MCTVTYVRVKDGFILTSSRDEKVYRETIRPKSYALSSQILTYPEDALAHGTWIAHSDTKRMSCLLNGAFEKHTKKSSYRKSRGLILLDSFNYSSIDLFIQDVNLEDIEPFTLLMIDYKEDFIFKELVWDGKSKYVNNIEQNRPNIWSSSTLYDSNDRAMRKSWFDDWIVKYRNDESFNIFQFHDTNHSDLSNKDIVMKRENDLQTVSITQIQITNELACMKYYDFKNSIYKISLR